MLERLLFLLPSSYFGKLTVSNKINSKTEKGNVELEGSTQAGYPHTSISCSGLLPAISILSSEALLFMQSLLALLSSPKV